MSTPYLRTNQRISRVVAPPPRARATRPAKAGQAALGQQVLKQDFQAIRHMSLKRGCSLRFLNRARLLPFRFAGARCKRKTRRAGKLDAQLAVATSPPPSARSR